MSPKFKILTSHNLLILYKHDFYYFTIMLKDQKVAPALDLLRSPRDGCLFVTFFSLLCVCVLFLI
mgnify:CR=1 FL=1